MATTAIILQVDVDTAQAYRAAPAEDRSKLNLLLNLWLRGLTTQSTSLSLLMDNLSDKAEARGLTPETLEEMLNAR